MPEVTVRKRLGKRSGGWQYNVRRWSYRNRSRLAVAIAFAAAVGFAIVVAFAIAQGNVGTSITDGAQYQ